MIKLLKSLKKLQSFVYFFMTDCYGCQFESVQLESVMFEMRKFAENFRHSQTTPHNKMKGIKKR